MAYNIIFIRFKAEEGGKKFYVTVDNDTPTLFVPPQPATDFYFSQERRFSSLRGLSDMGYGLFRGVFNTPERREKIEKTGPGKHLSLAIISDELFIHQLPWELLGMPKSGDFIFLLRDARYSLYRALLNPPKFPTKAIDYPLRLLVILSLPFSVYEVAPISILEEWESIYQTLKPFIKEGKLIADVEERANKQILRERIEKGDYQLIHFVGHGQEGGRLVIEGEDPWASPDILNSDDIADIFRGKGIVSVFFNACETAASFAYLPDFLYVLQKRCGVPISMGYQGPIADEKALRVAKEFYAALLSGEYLAPRLTEIRKLFEINDDVWWRPVYWLEPEAKAALEFTGTPKPREEAKLLCEGLPSIGKDFIYRYIPLRQIGDAFREAYIKLIYVHGIGGAGKTLLTSYISQFYKFLFDGIRAFQCQKDLTPQKVIKDTARLILKRDLKEEALDLLWQEFKEALEDKKILIILDNLDELQDIEGRLDETWDRFLTLILRTDWPGKALITSRVKLHLNIWQPGYKEGALSFIALGQFLENEAKDYIKRQELKDLWPLINEYTGHHPFGLYLISEAIKNASLDEIRKEPGIFLETLEERCLVPMASILADKERKEILKLALPDAFPFTYFRKACPDKTLREKLERWAFIEQIKRDERPAYCIPKVIASYLKRKAKTEDIKEAAYFAAPFFEKEDRIQAFYLWLEAEETKRAEKTLAVIYSCLRPLGYWSLLEAMINKLLKRDLEDKSRAIWLNNLGSLAQDQGRYEEAKRYYEGSLRIAKQIGDKKGEATTYNNLGLLAQVQGRYEEAKRYYEGSLKIKKQIGDKEGEATTYNNLGSLAQEQGIYEEAKRCYEGSLRIAKQIGDKEGEATTYNNLGLLAKAQGIYEEAKRYYEGSLKIKKQIGDKEGEATTYNNLGLLAQDQGRYEEAIEFYLKALEIVYHLRHAELSTVFGNLLALEEKLGKKEFEKLAKKHQPAGYELFKHLLERLASIS